MRKKNPLVTGYSPDSIGKNIAHALKRRLPHAQAIAIALEIARREYRKVHPVGNFPRYLQGAGKFYKKNPGRKNLVKKKVKRKNLVKKKVKMANPVSTLIKVFKHGPGEKKFQKVGYFTGTGWDTSVSKAEKYSAGKARELANQLKIPTGWGLVLISG